MIHLKSYQPTHQQMARVEHAMVVNRRRYYALREAGMLDLAEEVRLDLELMNLSYWKYHSQGVNQNGTPDASLEGSSNLPRLHPDTLEDRA